MIINSLETFFVETYALSWYLLCQKMLQLIELNEAEKDYVAVKGPEIVSLHYIHDSRSQHGGCSEARTARRQVLGLEEVAKIALSASGVSEERQKILERLLIGSHGGYFMDFGPKSLEHVFHHMSVHRKNGDFSAMLKMLEELKVRNPGLETSLKKIIKTAELVGERFSG